MSSHKQIIKWIALILSWATISPLFLFLTYRWRMLKKWLRWILTLVSPLCIFIFSMLFLIVVLWIFSRPPRDDKYYSNEQRLEKITGVRFEIKKVVEYIPGKCTFTGDYSSTTKILLKNIPNYEKLDSLTQKKVWSKTKKGYSFSAMWGNGIAAPEGEDEEDDRCLYIDVVYNCDTLYIESGRW